MFSRIFFPLFHPFQFLRRHLKILGLVFLVSVIGVLILLAIGKKYQRWDDDPDRGAIAITSGAFGEAYSIPEYLD